MTHTNGVEKKHHVVVLATTLHPCLHKRCEAVATCTVILITVHVATASHRLCRALD